MEEMGIDLLQILKVLWKKVWIIVLAAVLAGAIVFSYAFFLVAPEYEAEAMMYVNNSSFSVGSTNFSISSSDLSAASTLLDIYVVILHSRTTLQLVIDRAGLDYTWEQLGDMISAGPVDGTEVFRITATSTDPAEAKRIVDTITEVLPERIAEVVDGSSVRIVDTAVLPTEHSAPDYSRFAIIGLILGAVLSCGVITILDLLDNTVRDEAYIIERYNLPILASIPDVNRKSASLYRDYAAYRSEK